MQPFSFFLFYFTAAGVKCREAAVKRLPVLHHSADYTFYFLWDHRAHSDYMNFENQIPLNRCWVVLGMGVVEGRGGGGGRWGGGGGGGAYATLHCCI